MTKNILEKYKDIICKIQRIKRGFEYEPQYYNGITYGIGPTGDYEIKDVIGELESLFPNLSFSVNDLFKLWDYSSIKYKYDRVINKNIENMTFIEKNYYYEARKDNNKAKADENYTNYFTTFFYLCELLNGNEQDTTFNTEHDIFEPLYEYKFKLRPKNKILMDCYELYEKYRSEKEKNVELTNLNQDNKVRIEAATEEINELKKEVSNLKGKLSKAKEFYKSIKDSVIGQVFYKKKIEATPELNIDEFEEEFDSIISNKK